jgi:MFS transporter, UMF1 family
VAMQPEILPLPPRAGADRRARLAWASYDWANSAFSVVVITFVFATYFSQAIAPDPVTGTSQWALALTLSGLGVILAAPVVGAITDVNGRRKPWLLAFTATTVVLCWALWFATPTTGMVLYALVVVALANVAFELCNVLYNAMLPELTTPDRVGRLSGWAWSLGYFGGIVCLLFALFAFVQTETPLFGLDPATAEPARAAGPLVAVWFGVFSIPLFLFTPDRPSAGLPLAVAARKGLAQLAGTFRRIGAYRNILRFLIARAIYTDGLNTLFTFGGIYAAGTFGMALSEVMLFGVVLNLAAGIGAFLFGWVDDWIGPRRTILLALVGLFAFGLMALLVERVALFWIAGTMLGSLVGPVQAASRSLMARLAPAELRTEMFGFYAFTGKIVSFAGPAVLGTLTWLSGSQRIGMSTVLAFWIVGGTLLLKVDEPPAAPAAA